MEHNSDLVSLGKLLHERSYAQRSDRYKEVSIDGIKIDYFDAKSNTIHEIKRSNKRSEAHYLQLKYYIYVLAKNGIEGVLGILEYPLLRIKEEVVLSSIDIEEIKVIENKILAIIGDEKCPNKIQESRCKKCSYYDFCYSNE